MEYLGSEGKNRMNEHSDVAIRLRQRDSTVRTS